MYDIEFNGASCRDHNAYVRQRPNITLPQEEVEQFRVAGRDGVLTGNRYLPPMELYIPMNFRSSSGDGETWAERFRDIRRWLTGSGELIQSDDDEYYLKVLNAQIEESERIIKRYGWFTAHFTCDPYFYRIDGKEEYSITNPKILDNEYDTSHPIYVFIGSSGTRTLTVNGNAVSVVVNGETMLDTDRMITYTTSDMVLRNTRLTGDYEDLYLRPGTNTITATGTGLKIIPNWRTR